MPQLSAKSHAMPASPIRKLVPYAEKAKQRGTVVHHLNIGQPDISTPKVVLDELKNLKIDYVIFFKILLKNSLTKSKNLTSFISFFEVFMYLKFIVLSSIYF